MDVEKDLKTRESTYLLLDLVSTVNDCLILHDKIIYILIDFIFQIVQQSPYLTMDVLESCFPYALLRNAYHEVYKVNCLSVLNAAWFSYCVSCFSSVFPFFFLLPWALPEALSLQYFRTTEKSTIFTYLRLFFLSLSPMRPASGFAYWYSPVLQGLFSDFSSFPPSTKVNF